MCVCVYMCVCVCARAQLLSPVRLSSLPGSSVHGISQARILSFPTLGDHPDPEIEPTSPATAGGFFTNSATIFIQPNSEWAILGILTIFQKLNSLKYFVNILSTCRHMDTAQSMQLSKYGLVVDVSLLSLSNETIFTLELTLEFGVFTEKKILLHVNFQTVSHLGGLESTPLIHGLAF